MHRQSHSADSLFTVATSKKQNKDKGHDSKLHLFQIWDRFQTIPFGNYTETYSIGPSLISDVLSLNLSIWIGSSSILDLHLARPSLSSDLPRSPCTVHPSGCWSYGLLVRWWYRWLGGELLESGFNLRRTYIKVLPKGQLHWSQLGSFPIWGPDSQLSGHAGDC